MKRLGIDVRHVLSRPGQVALCVLSPVVVLLTLASVFLPMVGVSKALHFNLAICNQDTSQMTEQFVTQFLHSSAMIDLVVPYEVDSCDVGRELVAAGRVSAMIEIPDGFYAAMGKAEPVTLTVYATASHALESNLVTIALDTTTTVVGKGNNLFFVAEQLLVAHGMDAVAAGAEADVWRTQAIDLFMNRRAALGETGIVEGIGEFLPVEYYAGVVFAVFAAFAILPLVGCTARDLSAPVVRRGFLTGGRVWRFWWQRVLSGAVLVALVLTAMVPATALMSSGSALFGAFSGSWLALAAVICASALAFSTIALAIALWTPNPEAGMWAGFYVVLLMSVAGGALIPSSSLPDVVAAVGGYAPTSITSRLLSGALSGFESQFFTADLLRIGAWTLAAAVFSWWGLTRRATGHALH
jgi:hypothetical protein